MVERLTKLRDQLATLRAEAARCRELVEKRRDAGQVKTAVTLQTYIEDTDARIEHLERVLSEIERRLERATSNIERSRAVVERQRELVQRLKMSGHSTTEAEMLLSELLRSLDIFNEDYGLQAQALEPLAGWLALRPYVAPPHGNGETGNAADVEIRVSQIQLGALFRKSSVSAWSVASAPPTTVIPEAASRRRRSGAAPRPPITFP